MQDTSVGLGAPHYDEVTPVKTMKGMSRNGRPIELELVYKKLYTSEARKHSPHQLYTQSAKQKTMYQTKANLNSLKTVLGFKEDYFSR